MSTTSKTQNITDYFDVYITLKDYFQSKEMFIDNGSLIERVAKSTTFNSNDMKNLFKLMENYYKLNKDDQKQGTKSVIDDLTETPNKTTYNKYISLYETIEGEERSTAKLIEEIKEGKSTLSNRVEIKCHETRNENLKVARFLLSAAILNLSRRISPNMRVFSSSYKELRSDNENLSKQVTHIEETLTSMEEDMKKMREDMNTYMCKFDHMINVLTVEVVKNQKAHDAMLDFAKKSKTNDENLIRALNEVLENTNIDSAEQQ